MPEPFFTATDGGLLPHPDARSPWSPDMLHGRLLAGLAAWAVERDHHDPDLQPVRLTVDLYKSPTMEATTVATTLVRDGRRVRVVDAHLQVGGVEVARASTLFLRRADAAQLPAVDDAPRTPPWDTPPPDALPALPMPSGSVPFEVRAPEGSGFGAPSDVTRRVWMRENRPLVGGTDLSPFVRAALLADFASPLANMGTEGLSYINADLTLHLSRLPVGEWLGISTDDRVAADGVSVAQCPIHDTEGPVGWSSVSAVLTPAMPRPAS
ncbi:MAG TPA: acyl-CoA thioesterase domain-containing protein [Acidimicrobiales bacterium]